MDAFINEFRLASRELFNNFFLKPFLVNEDWALYEHFDLIEAQLFSALVTSRVGIPEVRYGEVQPDVLVFATSPSLYGIPIMLNREIDSGYWDHDVDTAVPGCLFSFLSFFDWDQKSYKDNRYVRVVVREWPENPSLVGKHALIETHYVSYGKA